MFCVLVIVESYPKQKPSVSITFPTYGMEFLVSTPGLQIKHQLEHPLHQQAKYTVQTLCQNRLDTGNDGADSQGSLFIFPYAHVKCSYVYADSIPLL